MESTNGGEKRGLTSRARDRVKRKRRNERAQGGITFRISHFALRTLHIASHWDFISPFISHRPPSHSMYQSHRLREFSVVPPFQRLGLVEQRRPRHREREGRPLRDFPNNIGNTTQFAAHAGIRIRCWLVRRPQGGPALGQTVNASSCMKKCASREHRSKTYMKAATGDKQMRVWCRSLQRCTIDNLDSDGTLKWFMCLFSMLACTWHLLDTMPSRLLNASKTKAWPSLPFSICNLSLDNPPYQKLSPDRKSDKFASLCFFAWAVGIGLSRTWP